jgi:hypothetical protein
MVHRHQATALVDVFQQGRHVAIAAHTEVDPAVDAPHVGVPAVGGDLHAGQPEEPLARHGVERRVVADRVVVGHGQHVEPAFERGRAQVAQRAARVAVVRVALQVGAVPAGARATG